MRRTSAGEAFTELILEVFRLNGRLLNAGDALTRPMQQTSARWQVLGALDDGARTVADIGRRMGLARQSVQRTADLLEADGLVSYADNPAHQRARLATLTPRGRATLQEITTRQIDWVNRTTARLDARDLQNTIETLRQLRAALETRAPDDLRSGKRASPGTRRGAPGGTIRRGK
jgi:DNA-binding MarR family transcriptional regulator